MTKHMVDLIKKHEGLRLKPYKCTAGKTTIGYGRNLDDVGIDEDEAEYLLIRDVKKAEYEVTRVFGADLPYTLSDNRFSVLVNMMFNLGYSRFNGFKKMIQAVKDGDYDKASREMSDSAWAKQVPARASELIKIMTDG